MKNKIACTTGGYHGSDLDRVFLGLSKAGFKYVELSAMPSPKARIPLESMTEKDLDVLKASLKSHDLVPVSLSGHSDLTTAQGVAFFKRRIDFAHDLGIEIINTGAAHGDSPQEVELFYAHMQEVIPYARERDVHIALETHGGMTGTAPDCLQTLERLQSEWVGINYDTANVIYYRGVRPEEDLRLIAPYVIHVHLKDKRGGLKVYDFPPLGEGNIDFVSIVETLAAVRYAGPYSAEIEMEQVDDPEQEDEVMAKILSFMEHLLGDS